MSSNRLYLGLLVVATAALRVLWAGGLELGHDEAYYYQFVLRPDWSYHDHPPMLAVVQGMGLLLGGGISATSLRLGFIAIFAGSTLLMARLGSRFFGGRAGLLAAVLLNATAYFALAAGTFVLPDGPLVFFWLLTLDRLALAFETEGKTWPWVEVGLAWGCAMLSKYQAALLPLGTLLYLGIMPTARHWLKRPGPYVAVAIGLAVFSPVIFWNARNGWVSFAFQGGRAVGSLEFRADRLGAFLVGQCFYLLPWVWFFLMASAWRRRELFLGGGSEPARQGEAFLLAHAGPPVLIFTLLACFRPVLPHWSLPGFLCLMPLAGADWARMWRSRPVRMRRRVAYLLLSVWVGASVFVAQARWGVVTPAGGMASSEADPTRDLHGWDQVAAAIRERGYLSRPGTFVFSSKWYHSGHLAFALGPEVPVLCYSATNAHGYAQWSRPEDWLGRDGILVVAQKSSTEPQVYDRWFERIERLGEVEVQRGGLLIRRVELYRCVGQTQPFPFDGRASGKPGSSKAEPDGLAQR